MPKLTIEELFDKRMEEVRGRFRGIKPAPTDLIERLRQAARSRLPRLPRI